ncbi:hypothetical protein GQ54DRAFT_118271 [Martensiomyces pterosporus]|nr:hypothetical protein GQ54DRAFT_118271 [Martensiomyces pterosporus]
MSLFIGNPGWAAADAGRGKQKLERQRRLMRLNWWLQLQPPLLFCPHVCMLHFYNCNHKEHTQHALLLRMRGHMWASPHGRMETSFWLFPAPPTLFLALAQRGSFSPLRFSLSSLQPYSHLLLHQQQPPPTHSLPCFIPSLCFVLLFARPWLQK